MCNVSVNKKCSSCSMKSLVTKTISGASIGQPYYQCVAGMTAECLGDDSMTVYEDETDGEVENV